jgi:hypothetical protein
VSEQTAKKQAEVAEAPQGFSKSAAPAKSLDSNWTIRANYAV